MDEDPASTREKRSSVIVRAEIDIDGARSERRVRNLSLTGACIENRGDLSVGMTIQVAMGVLDPLLADVVWATEALVGLKFHGTVDLAAARTPRSALNVPRGGWIADIGDAYRGPPRR